MKAHRTLIFVAALALPAAAQDKWIASDKFMHFGGGAVLGGFGTVITENKHAGFGIGCLAGLAKEISDRRGTGFSMKDWAVTCGGAWLGAQLGDYLVRVTRNSIQVSRSF
jgi:uncharacterized protein YfiM (DUF2279 family)